MVTDTPRLKNPASRATIRTGVPMPQTTITVYATPRGYMARWSGAEEPEIQRLFGTDTLPAAYGPEANPQEVRTIIARLNPACDVVLADR